MIGMMNSGAETSVEFYASARQSSLYDNRKRSNQSRTYTPEGRVMINGEPQSPCSVDNLWSNVLIKATARRMIRECEKPKGGALATIRRLSSKLKFGSGKSNHAKLSKIDEDPAQFALNFERPSASVVPAVIPDDKYITMIRVETAEGFHTEDPEIRRPNTLYNNQNDSVLVRLIEESSRLDRRQNENKSTDDSGKGSFDEIIKTKPANNNSIVEKF